MTRSKRWVPTLAILLMIGLPAAFPGTAPGVARADEALPEVRLKLDPARIVNESDIGDPSGLLDEQDKIIGPPAGSPDSSWKVNSQYWKDGPVSVHIDLGEPRNLSKLWLYDTNGTGEVVISVGEPGDWEEFTTYDCGSYLTWVPITMDVTTRYVRLTRKSGGANFSEVAIYAYTPQAHKAMLARQAEEARLAAERAAALEKARAEMRKRPLVDVGPPFGKLYLIDEIDCAAETPDHRFSEDPAGASHVETILGRRARVLDKTEGEAAYFSYRIGEMKLLEPGMAYVLEVTYPQDAPRSVIVMNGGDETTRGFFTGQALGDAMHPKYVNNLVESIDVPLSGEWETWKTLFYLHDRTPNRDFIRGKGLRELTAEDGFTVTIAQFSAENIPLSHGAAVSKIRLYGVPNPEKFDAQVNLPPGDLPHRHLFWREEMADGVVGATKDATMRGVEDPIDWWRFKRETMQFLGMNTYTKDLLEFGSNQHWDPTEGGGNDWVYFNSGFKDYWEQIVQMMGEAGFDILPYYEYAGSKGKHGLGPQRRAKPLTRDDAYTHIKWVESSNADITDPDTYEDFKKMLKLTIVKFKDDAHFIGAWLRPRMQIPMGFGDATRARFAEEANGGKEVSRQDLIDSEALLAKYEDWWYGKRREFLVAMRDYLRESGIDDAVILYTAAAGEPGVGFGDWEKRLITDDPATWMPILARPEHTEGGPITPVTVEQVVRQHLYLKGLLSPPPTWGGWEWGHASPPADPKRYKDTQGVLMTHAFNRLYTVSDPATFEAFRGPAGLAIIRHYTLNENMMFDENGKAKLGYFVADIERAGPFCMMGEAYAMANGDPTYIGYLVGGNYTRGFPYYARNFNTAFLALPAMPSRRLPDASSDPEVVVRSIETDSHGTYLAVVNLGFTDKSNVEIRLPTRGKVTDAATGEAIDATGGVVSLSMYPCQLRSLHIE